MIDKNFSPLENVKKLCNYIKTNFNYQKGLTNVFTTTDEVLKLKSGVCQDFTNLLIQLCRMSKIPTRYVSGYVFADEGLRGAGATHAWAEILIPNYGWLGLDPTNNCIADQFHIRLAVGRNYNDCAPVKGVFKGKETQLMDVKVHLDTKRKTKNLESANPRPSGLRNTSKHYPKQLQKKLRNDTAAAAAAAAAIICL